MNKYSDEEKKELLFNFVTKVLKNKNIITHDLINVFDDAFWDYLTTTYKYKAPDWQDWMLIE